MFRDEVNQSSCDDQLTDTKIRPNFGAVDDPDTKRDSDETPELELTISKGGINTLKDPERNISVNERKYLARQEHVADPSPQFWFKLWSLLSHKQPDEAFIYSLILIVHFCTSVGLFFAFSCILRLAPFCWNKDCTHFDFRPFFGAKRLLTNTWWCAYNLNLLSKSEKHWNGKWLTTAAEKNPVQ